MPGQSSRRLGPLTNILTLPFTVMFIGHFAAGLAAKRVAPRTSLGTLFAAVQLPDLIWPLLLLAGVERVEIAPGDTAYTPLAFTHYPFTHSLLAVLGWAGAAALLYWAATRYRAGAAMVGLGVLSHWLLDAIVHRPDLPLVPGSEAMVGLSLWNAPVLTIVLEAAMLVAGVWLYASATRPRNRIGTYALWALLAVIVLIAAGNAAGPPPADVRSLAVFALAGWLLPLWAFWADRNRLPAEAERRGVPAGPVA